MPPTSVSDELLAKLEAMTLEELEAVAKPMPDEALGDLPYGGKFLDHIAKLPQDGENFPDALTGSVLAAKLDAPILLIDNKGEEQKKFIDKSNYSNLILLGGTSAISEKVEALLKQ